MKPTLLGLAVTLAWASPAETRQTPMLPDQRSYDWTDWLEGEWEGYQESSTGDRVKHVQSFEYVVDGRYIFTTIRQEVAPGQWYTGSGMFRYDPTTNESTGEWFGIVGDRNLGLGRREGDRWIWDIDRAGRDRVLRIRERVGPDEYRVTSTTVTADGGTRVTREVMRRRARGAPRNMPAAYRRHQAANLNSQRNFLHALADSMPERLYADADSPGQRSFAGHVYHAGVALAQAAARRFEGPAYSAPDETSATANRAALKASIDSAFDYLLALHAAQTDAQRAAETSFGGKTLPVWQVWDEFADHTYWTAGEMVGNFRKHGMPPPAFRFF